MRLLTIDSAVGVAAFSQDVFDELKFQGGGKMMIRTNLRTRTTKRTRTARTRTNTRTTGRTTTTPGMTA